MRPYGTASPSYTARSTASRARSRSSSRVRDRATAVCSRSLRRRSSRPRPPTLRAETNGEREVLADGTTVRELLDDVAARFPALGARILDNGGLAPFVNVYVEGEDVRTRDGLQTPVDEASTVILLPAMAGG